MAKRINQPRHTVDPFDIDWTVTDPLGRDVTMLKSIERARAGKHRVPPEFLSTGDVKAVVEGPTRIDESSSSETRNIYYRHEPDMDYPYSRAVVDFKGDPGSGFVVSWSRYQQPVSSYGVIWNGGDDADI